MTRRGSGVQFPHGPPQNLTDLIGAPATDVEHQRKCAVSFSRCHQRAGLPQEEDGRLQVIIDLDLGRRFGSATPWVISMVR